MATFRGQAEYTIRRSGAVYVFIVKFLREEAYFLPNAGFWMPAEIIITSTYLSEAMSQQDDLVTMRLPLGWNPVAGMWLSNRMDDDSGVFDDVIELCEAEYRERTSR